MTRIAMRRLEGPGLIGTRDAITHEPTGPGHVVLVCDRCQSVVRMTTVRNLASPAIPAGGGTPPCPECRHASMRREFALPETPEFPVRLEYVSLVANVVAHVQGGIGAPGRGSPTDDWPGRDPIPARPGNRDAILPDGTWLGEYVTAYFNARNARAYGYLMRMRDQPLVTARKAVTCLVRLAPWVATVAGAWVADGSVAARATALLPAKEGLRSLDFDVIHARWWRDTRPGAPFMIDEVRRRQMQAGLLVPDWVPQEAFEAIVVADRATAHYLQRALASIATPVPVPPVVVDPGRFFDGHPTYLPPAAGLARRLG